MIVQCRLCEFKQPEGAVCRRCGRSLPKNPPQVIVQEKVVETVKEIPVIIPCSSCGHLQGHIPTVDHMERSLFEAAQKTIVGIDEICQQLGIGKTTYYRKLKEYGKANDATGE